MQPLVAAAPAVARKFEDAARAVRTIALERAGAQGASLVLRQCTDCLLADAVALVRPSKVERPTTLIRLRDEAISDATRRS
jgi:hypothetical protein